jgi:hypothetical protein
MLHYTSIPHVLIVHFPPLGFFETNLTALLSLRPTTSYMFVCVCACFLVFFQLVFTLGYVYNVYIMCVWFFLFFCIDLYLYFSTHSDNHFCVCLFFCVVFCVFLLSSSSSPLIRLSLFLPPHIPCEAVYITHIHTVCIHPIVKKKKKTKKKQRVQTQTHISPSSSFPPPPPHTLPSSSSSPATLLFASYTASLAC